MCYSPEDLGKGVKELRDSAVEESTVGELEHPRLKKRGFV